MSVTHLFWTHGLSAVVEFPDRPEVIRHAGWGTLIQQGPDPVGRHNNWFHLPLHSPRSFHGVPAWFGTVRLKADTNVNATIHEIHIRQGWRLVYKEEVALTGDVDYLVDTREPVPGGFNYPISDISDGLILSIRVQFAPGEPIGRIVFIGAGADFTHPQSGMPI